MSYGGTGSTTIIKPTRSVSFVASPDHADMGNISALDFDSDDSFSICFWFNTSTAFATILGKVISSSPFTGYGINLQGNINPGDIRFALISSTVTTDRIAVDFGQGFNDGVWHQCIGTYDGSLTAAGITLYVDRVSQSGTVDFDSLTGSIQNSVPFQVSGIGNGTISGYVGLLNNLAIYNKELSQSEVNELNGYPGVGPVDHSEVGPTENLVGYWPMGSQDTFPGLGDRSVNNNTGTLVSLTASDIVDSAFEPSPQPNKIREWNGTRWVTRSDERLLLDRSTDPIGLWHLNGDFLDYSGNQRDLTPTNSPDYNMGPISGVRSCDMIQAGNEGVLDDNTFALLGELTVEAVVWIDGAHRGGASPTAIVSYNIDDPDSNDEVDNTLWSIVQTSTGFQYFHEAGSGSDQTLSVVFPPFRQWMHVTITRASNGTDVKMFFNGTKVLDDSVGSAPTGGSNSFLKIGSLFGVATDSFNGLISSVRIHDYEFSEEAVLSAARQALAFK